MFVRTRAVVAAVLLAAVLLAACGSTVSQSARRAAERNNGELGTTGPAGGDTGASGGLSAPRT